MNSSRSSNRAGLLRSPALLVVLACSACDQNSRSVMLTYDLWDHGDQCWQQQSQERSGYNYVEYYRLAKEDCEDPYPEIYRTTVDTCEIWLGCGYPFAFTDPVFYNPIRSEPISTGEICDDLLALYGVPCGG